MALAAAAGLAVQRGGPGGGVAAVVGEGAQGVAGAMARQGVWATVLEEQAAAVGAAFPQWAEAARRAAEQGRRPVADPGVVRELLDSFGRWAEDELDRAVSKASNLDGRAR